MLETVAKFSLKVIIVTVIFSRVTIVTTISRSDFPYGFQSDQLDTVAKFSLVEIIVTMIFSFGLIFILPP